MSDLYKLTVGTRVGSKTGEIGSAMNVQVESAIKDSEGNKICDTFLKKSVGTASQGVVVDNADTKFIAEVTDSSSLSTASYNQEGGKIELDVSSGQDESKLLLSDSLFKISTDANGSNHTLTFDANGNLNFVGQLFNSEIFQPDGREVKKATTAGTATKSTNSTWAAHIGSSDSYTSIGNSVTPVFINTAGTVKPCKSFAVNSAKLELDKKYGIAELFKQNGSTTVIDKIHSIVSFDISSLEISKLEQIRDIELIIYLSDSGMENPPQQSESELLEHSHHFYGTLGHTKFEAEESAYNTNISGFCMSGQKCVNYSQGLYIQYDKATIMGNIFLDEFDNTTSCYTKLKIRFIDWEGTGVQQYAYCPHIYINYTKA